MTKFSKIIDLFYKYAQDPLNNMRTELETFTKTNGLNVFMEYMNTSKKYPESGVITLNLQVSGSNTATINIVPTVIGSTPNLDSWAKVAFKTNGAKFIANLKKVAQKHSGVPMPIEFPIKTEFPIDVE